MICLGNPIPFNTMLKNLQEIVSLTAQKNTGIFRLRVDCLTLRYYLRKYTPLGSGFSAPRAAVCGLATHPPRQELGSYCSLRSHLLQGSKVLLNRFRRLVRANWLFTWQKLYHRWMTAIFSAAVVPHHPPCGKKVAAEITSAGTKLFVGQLAILLKTSDPLLLYYPEN